MRWLFPLLGSFFLSSALAAELPAQQQALLIMKILAYDRNLDARGDSGLQLVVVSRSGDDASERCGAQITSALQQASAKVKVAGHQLTVRQLPADNPSALAGAGAAYLCSGLEAGLAQLSSTSREADVLTFTSVEAYLGTLSVGLFSRGGKPTIVVNLPASKAEGANLDANLLRLAEVHR